MKNKVISLFGDQKVVQNEGRKYSDLLNQFIKPFEHEFPEDFYTDDVIEFSINAWNFGNLGNILPKEEFEKIMTSAEAERIEYRDLLNRMIDSKVANFKKHDRFIAEFDLEENGEELVLTVATEDQESYLMNMMNEPMEKISEAEYEENYINRQAIVLRLKQPFYDWLKELTPDDEIAEVHESNIYLIDEDIDLDQWLRKKFDNFFVMELEEWSSLKKEWPQRRTFKMFKEWFHVDVSSMIYDMERTPVSKFEDF